MLKKQFNKKDFTTVDYKRIHVQQPKGVDLNTLMQRVKEDKKKEKKNNLIFIGAAISSVVITGLIISL